MKKDSIEELRKKFIHQGMPQGDFFNKINRRMTDGQRRQWNGLKSGLYIQADRVRDWAKMAVVTRSEFSTGETLKCVQELITFLNHIPYLSR